MKRIIITIAFAAALCSCTGILDTAPKGQLSDNNMWTNANLSRAGMDGIMYLFMRHEGYSSNELMKSSGNGGLNRLGVEGMGYTSIFDGDIKFLKGATKNASIVECYADWRMLYSVIHASNKAIKHLDKNVVGESLYNQYICEAKMLRAFSYSRLNMLYGGVPLYLEEIDDSECTKAQSSWKEVWDAVIKDCNECIDNEFFQTNNLTGNRQGKPSKGMAYALRGNAYMWLAANKNPEIDEISEGSLTTAEIETFYKKAAEDFAKVKECGFGLWNGVWEEFFREQNEHNIEMIFPIEFSTEAGFSSYWQWPISSRSQLNGWNRIVPSCDFVDDFEWADGTKFSWKQVFPDWNKLQVEKKEVFFLRDSLDTFSTMDTTGLSKDRINKIVTLRAQREKAIEHVGMDTWTKYYLDNGNEARLRTAYDGRDPRLDKVVVTPYKPYKMYNTDNPGPINFVLRWPRFTRQDTVEYSDLWMEFSSNMMYAWYKYVIADGSVDDREKDGCDWPALRFTQIQLMWAEALLQTGDQGGAKTLLNEIRLRAGMPEVTSSDDDEIMEEIRYESRVELCQEGKDFFNEIRWGTFMDTKFQGEEFWDPKAMWGEGKFKSGYYYVQGMWPLSAPLDEIVRNSNLKRRPIGWAY